MTESAMQAMLDRDAIREVRALVAQALDYQDWTLFESLFVEEVDADFSDFGVPAQKIHRSELRQSYQHNLRREGLRTQHLFTNFRITLAGDTAQCVSNFVGQHFLAGFAGGEEFIIHAEYRDQLLRTANGWKITALTFKQFYMSGNAAIIAP